MLSWVEDYTYERYRSRRNREEKYVHRWQKDVINERVKIPEKTFYHVNETNVLTCNDRERDLIIRPLMRDIEKFAIDQLILQNLLIDFARAELKMFLHYGPNATSKRYSKHLRSGIQRSKEKFRLLSNFIMRGIPARTFVEKASPFVVIYPYIQNGFRPFCLDMMNEKPAQLIVLKCVDEIIFPKLKRREIRSAKSRERIKKGALGQELMYYKTTINNIGFFELGDEDETIIHYLLTEERINNEVKKRLTLILSGWTSDTNSGNIDELQN